MPPPTGTSRPFLAKSPKEHVGRAPRTVGHVGREHTREVLVARRRARDPLRNATGRRIYECIRKTPGTGFTQLLATVNLNSTSHLYYHLDSLLDQGLIVEQREGKRRLFFASNADLYPQPARSYKARRMAEEITLLPQGGNS